MAPPADPELLDTAVSLARRAGELTLQWFRSADLVVEQKADHTPVTAADRAAERLLREELARLFPGDGIVGEEEADTPSQTGRRWVIDPIDGTMAFTRGVPLYTNLLAFDDEHGPAVGVINIPALSETVYAGRGLGCFDNGAPCAVSEWSDVAGAYLTSSSFSWYWPDEPLARVRAAGFEMRTWGDGYGYALVATGRVEAMVDPIAAPWDLAPMPVIIGEAGGRFSDWSGTEHIDGGQGVASNGHVHRELLGLLSGDAAVA
jgi:histidinol phosphatase-like enzyme (inositol monophosphatase family)